MGRRVLGALVVLVAVAALTACGGTSPPGAGDVGYLDAATGVSPREDGVATAVLPDSMRGANMLLAIATGDGPDNPAAQRSVLTDTGRHTWTLSVHHIVFGSIIDVYTAPANGAEAGTAVSSELTIKRGDEGHALAVMAYRNGRLGPTAERNGNFGLPQLTADVPAGHDVITVFGDGRQNAPVTLVPGFRPVLVFPVDGGPGGDQDLYQVSHLDPPGSAPGGPMLTGNTGPPGSGYWGLVDVTVGPATSP